MSAAVRLFKGRLSALCLRGLAPQTPGGPPVRDPVKGRRLSHSETGGGVAPLHGVRVLDLTRVLAGPFATMILGDLGAEVIKVERPGAGDDTRSWGPPFVGAESAYFLSINRNKKSICVDMKHPQGASVIKELAAVCDVLMENFLPGKLSSLGLGFDQLIRVNPRLVYCSISGYGQTGPLSQSPGYDSIASAVSGMMHITGPEDGGPVRPGVAMTDLATGLYAHGAVLAALLQRERTGGGAHIDCNLLSSQVSCLSHIAANFLNAGQEAKRWGTAHQSIVPYQGFSTRDGHIVVAAGNNTQFVRVCEVLQLKELAEDPKYKTNKLRVQHRKELLYTLSHRFLQETTADWLKQFEGSGVPVGPINNIQEVFSNPQVKHNGLIQEMKHPTAGTISVPGPAVRFSSFPPAEPTPPPVIGQHTVQVLRETLSYCDDVIDALLESSAVAQNAVS
ncbi:LOW QUALITY PROTEIN: succinate--hydroxymethylglutarate CoA-transferase [Eleginops maclovinus]|uniref:LOW QUALITY PROTEIN: succinate--hydroxymethylglutarate CoA-transferase n=1 Tax=Eleginops maclovinus TaxID=56733 RepID=UPI003080E18D